MKRFGGLALVLMLPFIVACKILPAIDGKPPENQQAQTDGESGPVTAQKADSTTVRPKPRPASLKADADIGTGIAVAAPEETPIPEPVIEKSRERVACEKKGGIWGNAGSTQVQSCIKRTKDAGKQCRKAGDCESACLARSGTCAPVKPLFGCNDILQKDGSRVTLCID